MQNIEVQKCKRVQISTTLRIVHQSKHELYNSFPINDALGNHIIHHLYLSRMRFYLNKPEKLNIISSTNEDFSYKLLENLPQM